MKVSPAFSSLDSGEVSPKTFRIGATSCPTADNTFSLPILPLSRLAMSRPVAASTTLKESL